MVGFRFFGGGGWGVGGGRVYKLAGAAVLRKLHGDCGSRHIRFKEGDVIRAKGFMVGGLSTWLRAQNLRVLRKDS